MIEIIIILAVVFIVNFLFFRRQELRYKTKETVNTDIEYPYNEFEIILVDEINKYRESLGLQRLEVNNYISNICLEHNNYMQKQGESSHDNFSERSENIMINLRCTSVGENVAFNFSTPKATLYAWLKSPKHKENLENPKWNIVGISNFSKFSTNIFAQLEN